MKVALVHLSDIHFTGPTDPLCRRADALAGAVRTADHECSDYVFLVSGDVAYSGKPSEYACANEFFNSLRVAISLRARTSINCQFAFIPGNHDCDFESDSDTRRLAITQMSSVLPSLDLTGDLVDKCLAVQQAFFAFVIEFTGVQRTGAARLIDRRVLAFGEASIGITCYNSAWLSNLKEVPGTLLFPIEQAMNSGYPTDSTREDQCSLELAMIHHPYNWMSPNNARRLKDHIEDTSDMIFTGHEHVQDQYLKDHFVGSNIESYEGGVLQDSQGKESRFSVIVVDLERSQRKVINYSWKGGLYAPEEGDWITLNRNRTLSRNVFLNTKAFRDYLTDLGTGFNHPSGRDLCLDDLFVWPDLTVRSFHRESAGKGITKTLRGRQLVDHILTAKRTLIVGSDLSGKTSLAKRLYVELNNTPQRTVVLLSGTDIAANPSASAAVIVREAIKRQYDAAVVTQIEQLSPSQKIIIIDDIDKSKQNTNGQKALINSISLMFESIVLVANEFFALGELSANIDSEHFLLSFEICTIKEFGYLLRGQLIERWTCIGRELNSTPQDIAHDINGNENLVQTVLGNNLLPSNPIIILIILQSWEANKSHDLSSGSYGYLYEALIFRALASANLRPPEVDIAKTFLSQLAYSLFTANSRTVTKTDLQALEGRYNKEYMMRLPEQLLTKLEHARILTRGEGSYRFTYDYYFYFFTAMYFRDAMARPQERESIRAHVLRLAERVYSEEFANILTFHIYFSKDSEAIGNILAVAKGIYSEHERCDLERDVEFVNALYTSPPELLLPASGADANRRAYQERLDQAGEVAIDEAHADEDESERQLSDVMKANMATKMLQIMGQVVKNSPGSLVAEVKQELVTEAYRLGLRTLKAILALPKSNIEGLRHYISELVKEHRALHKKVPLSANDLARMADQGVIWISQTYGSTTIRRIARAVGLSELSDIYSAVLDQHTTEIAVHLIDLSIKLEHFRDPPERQILELEKRLRPNAYAHNTLRDLVFGYLYLRDVDFRVRQRLISKLDISVAASRLVDNPAKRRRETEKYKRLK